MSKDDDETIFKFLVDWSFHGEWPDERRGAREMYAFVEARRAGRMPSDETMAWITSAFEKVIRGEKPLEALELKPTASGRTPSAAIRRRNAEIYFRLTRERARGVTAEDAIAAVAKRCRVSNATVEKVYKQYVAGTRSSLGVGGKE